ncbi:MAG: B12-binding domain-containing radical SAM protein [Clostridiales bacterium]|nr:B12-binding domain-containing radical SAM protein [Clostridiales bacterium]
MKRVVLAAVNAKYIHSNLAVFDLKAYAEASGRADGFELVIGEYTINQNPDRILADLYEKRPDVVAFSCYIWNISIIQAVASELKKVLPEVSIWYGGPEVSYDSQRQLMDWPWVTGIMRGEGEETFAKLLEYYKGMRELSQIDGITYHTESGVESTKNQAPLELSQIPFPYTRKEGLEHKIIYYESSRGCPYFCSYCLSSIERGVRFRKLELVKKELRQFLDWRVPQVKFVDRTFNCNQQHALAIWNYIKEQDNGITNFHFEISADQLTEEQMALLETLRPGLVQLEIGVQSTNEQTIEAISRKMDFSVLADRVMRIRKAGNIHQHLDLIAGLPYEDYESFRRSFQDVYNLHPDQLQLGFLKVLKGSAMWEKSKTYGISYHGQAPYEVLATPWLPYSDLLKLKQVEEMVEVYYNSGQFDNSVQYLLHYVEHPFDFYQSLGTFYHEKAYDQVNHTRIRRYEILLEYVKEQMELSKEETDAFLTLMVYDVYERENMKKRPAFAADETVWKNTFRQLYQDEEQMRQLLPVGYGHYDSKQLSRMTHMEHVWIDIEATVQSGRPVEKEQILLFDYQNRSPLNGNARIVSKTLD